MHKNEIMTVVAGLARLEEKLGKVETAVGQLVGAVVPPATTPTTTIPNPIHEAPPPRLGGNKQSLGALTTQVEALGKRITSPAEAVPAEVVPAEFVPAEVVTVSDLKFLLYHY